METLERIELCDAADELGQLLMECELVIEQFLTLLDRRFECRVHGTHDDHERPPG